jgi:hypothetical protein
MIGDLNEINLARKGVQGMNFILPCIFQELNMKAYEKRKE